jgi:hypothetical protein
MSRVEWTAWVVCMAVACGGGGGAAQVDGGAADAAHEPDAAPQPLGQPPSRLVISRGAAGDETLLLVDRTAGSQVQLSTGAGEPQCGGRVFCGLPPSGSIGRFPGSWRLGERLVVLDVPGEAWSSTRVDAYDLTDGTRTALAAQVDWPAVTPEWPFLDVPAWALHDGTLWLSLPVEGGHALYRTDGAAPLEELARLPLPAGTDYMETRVFAGAGGVAWTVRTRRQDDLRPYHYQARLLAPDGQVRARWPEDLDVTGTLIEFVQLAGTTAIVQIEAGAVHTLRVRTTDLDTLELPLGDGHFLWQPLGRERALSADGTRLMVGRQADDSLRLVDTTDGTVVDETVGSPIELLDDGGHRLLVAVPGEDVPLVRDADAHDQAVLAEVPAGVGLTGYNWPFVRFAPGGQVAVALAGAPFLAGWENVGVARIELATGEARFYEPPATSEDLTRQLDLSADGAWVLYLAPDAAGVLQVVAVELASGARVALTDGPGHVRAFLDVSAP